MPEAKGTILVSSARSGTNFLLSVYRKIFPDEFVMNEIFRSGSDSFAILRDLLNIDQDEAARLAEEDPVGLWQMVKTASQQKNKKSIAKIFYYHQKKENPIWKHFHENDTVIHLVRRNPFDVLVSHKIATQTGLWQDFGREAGRREDISLRLDVAELDAFIQRQYNYVEYVRNFFKDSDFTEVFYEDIQASANSCAAVLRGIKGVSETGDDINIALKKQKNRHNRELVVNYDEVSHLDRPYF